MDVLDVRDVTSVYCNYYAKRYDGARCYVYFQIYIYIYIYIHTYIHCQMLILLGKWYQPVREKMCQSSGSEDASPPKDKLHAIESPSTCQHIKITASLILIVMFV